jgi:hypothetical protein
MKKLHAVINDYDYTIVGEYETIMDAYIELLHDITTERRTEFKVYDYKIGFTATMGKTTYMVEVVDADDGDGLASAITKQLNEIGFL